MGRFEEPGRSYLLTASTDGRESVFTDFEAGCIVARSLSHLDRIGHSKTVAWVLMPDHLHWLVEPAGGSTPAGLMKSLKGYSARRINDLLGRSGRIWQPGFHDHAVREEEDLRVLTRYVVANPVRAGIVDDIGSYPFWDAAWI